MTRLVRVARYAAAAICWGLALGAAASAIIVTWATGRPMTFLTYVGAMFLLIGLVTGGIAAFPPYREPMRELVDPDEDPYWTAFDEACTRPAAVSPHDAHVRRAIPPTEDGARP